ncbi:unnamed protein product [Allacma fusca]|uniref:MD-2-related lipid-recognition domain-containing protein n=1 Tax=Allacma fusca TaxID=39272 RepID=A0A8J2NIH6_9HEXA|nr:unnamed protein product [Allacma fusca]
MYKFIRTTAIALLLSLELASGSGVEVIKCNSIGQLEKVEVTGCESLPCIFERGQDYFINVTFTPNGNSSNLRFNATANVYGITLPLMAGNACDILADGQKCPIKSGVQYKIKMAAKLTKFAPPIRKLLIKATIVDEFNKIQACAGLPARVV